jgi:hypothetical protein
MNGFDQKCMTTNTAAKSAATEQRQSLANVACEKTASASGLNAGRPAKNYTARKAAIEQSALGSRRQMSDHGAATTQKEVSATEQKQQLASKLRLGSCLKSSSAIESSNQWGPTPSQQQVAKGASTVPLSGDEGEVEVHSEKTCIIVRSQYSD